MRSNGVLKLLIFCLHLIVDVRLKLSVFGNMAALFTMKHFLLFCCLLLMHWRIFAGKISSVSIPLSQSPKQCFPLLYNKAIGKYAIDHTVLCLAMHGAGQRQENISACLKSLEMDFFIIWWRITTP